jgi:nucleotide-binding universal stress UspA family protein
MNILIATDFSESCEHALDYTKYIFGEHDVNFHLIHIYDFPLISSAAGRFDSIESILPKIEEDKKNKLEEAAETIKTKSSVATKLIYNSLTATTISEYADKQNIDLIVMGMRQKYSMIDRLIGTITANVIKKSEIPVLVIPNKSEIKQINRILFPTLTDVLNELNEKLNKELRFIGKLLTHKTPHVNLLRITDEETLDIKIESEIIPNSTYTLSNNQDIENGISKAIDKFNPDLIAIEKRNHTFWENLYRSDIIRKVLYKSRIPFLVL